MKYKVTYSETYAKSLYIEAQSKKEAAEKVQELFCNGNEDITETYNKWSAKIEFLGDVYFAEDMTE